MGIIILFVFYTLYTICFLVPRGLLLKLSKFCAFFLSFLPIPAVDRNLKVILNFQKLNGITSKPKSELKRKYYYYFLKNIIDFYKFLVIDPEQFYKVLKIDPLFDGFLKSYEDGQGIIFAGMHLGNWELGPLVGYKYKVKMSSLVFHQISPVFESLISSLRRRYGVNLLHQRKGIKEAINRLNDGEVLIFLGDQDGTKGGHFQKLCGMTCSYPRGIELFVKKTKAKVIPSILVHDGDNYRLAVEPDINCDEMRESKDFNQLHQQLKSVYEKYILEYPEQWLLVYDRFKFRHDKHLQKNGLYDEVKKEHEEMFLK
ncbi:MAG: hypothetical protein COB02_10955 [Candidatus Cloacimonadota bacterium]|nr:MAG: hypothetical protein COB02_10955 [Candidatus Cloacimonadota bacterium]